MSVHKLVQQRLCQASPQSVGTERNHWRWSGQEGAGAASGTLCATLLALNGNGATARCLQGRACMRTRDMTHAAFTAAHANGSLQLANEWILAGSLQRCFAVGYTLCVWQARHGSASACNPAWSAALSALK